MTSDPRSIVTKMTYLTFSSDRTSKTSITTTDMDHFLLKNSFLMKSHSRGLIDPKSPYFGPGYLHDTSGEHVLWCHYPALMMRCLRVSHWVSTHRYHIDRTSDNWKDLPWPAMPDAGIMSATAGE